MLTRTQQRVLGVLFAHPERSFYASELIRLARTGTGAAQRELARLEQGGLVTSRRIGHQKHYQANAESPLFPEIHSLIVKTVGLVEPLRTALAPLAGKIRAAFVYGSVAKNADRSESDIDLMVVSDRLTYGDLFGVLHQAAEVLGREVNPTVYTGAELARRRKANNAFLAKVLHGPRIWIMGTDDDLTA